MLTVCIATYNGEKYIRQQLNSVLIQLGENDEVIISDDSSSDATVEIVRSFNDSRIKLLVDNKFSSPVRNFENALKYATGDYIFLCDQDDIWLPDKVKSMLPYLKKQCDLVWLENLNLRGGFKQDILDYVDAKYPHLASLYHAIYQKGDRSYFYTLEAQAEQLAAENGCPFVDNELPYGRAEPGHPVIVNYFYHEEVRGSENTGRRKVR